MKTPSRSFRCAVVRAVSIFVIGFGCALRAQVAPAPVVNPAAPAPAAGDVVVLSPFAVVTEKDTGFVAASSLAGGRRKHLLDIDAADELAIVGAVGADDAEFVADEGAVLGVRHAGRVDELVGCDPALRGHARGEHHAPLKQPPSGEPGRILADHDRGLVVRPIQLRDHHEQ